MNYKNIGKLAASTVLALGAYANQSVAESKNNYIDYRVQPSLEHIVTENPTKINKKLIDSVIFAESNGNPNAERYESHIKDTSYGLMQILTGTARDISRRNPDLTSLDINRDGNTTYNEVKRSLLNPKTNVEYGTRFLEKNFKRFGEIELALAAYNAGQGAVVNALTQYELNKILGKDLDQDGNIGPKSRSAVKEFQREHGLSVDGKPGPNTRKKLKQIYSSMFPEKDISSGLIPENGRTPAYVKKILNKYNSK
jgi:hypothetical protein